MDTFVVSDLHIAVDDSQSLFAGGEALSRFVAQLAARPAPVRFVLNGDTFDFLVSSFGSEITILNWHYPPFRRSCAAPWGSPPMLHVGCHSRWAIGPCFWTLAVLGS
jgi:hypothetical protein